MKIDILVDDPDSWFIPFGMELTVLIKQQGHIAKLTNALSDLTGGDIAFLISCGNIVPESTLNLYEHCLVCHPSDLPKKRGMSPLTWSILEGDNEIVITLFEAVKAMDAGPIYYQDTLKFEGHELNEELKQAQGEATLALCLKFINNYPNNPAREQVGEPTFVARRKPEDSRLDIHKSIAEQFNLLRVCDNDRYPAYFENLGQRYQVKITKV